MLFAIIIVVILWLVFRKMKITWTLGLLAVGFMVAYLLTIGVGMGPLTEIQVGVDEVLRVSPPLSFPFTQQQYRDYSSGTFYYRIVLGWPNGNPVFEFSPQEDQSHFIHAQNYLTLGYIGLISLTGVIITIFVLWLVGRRLPLLENPVPRNVYLTIYMSVFGGLFALMAYFSEYASSVYFITALGAVVITFILWWVDKRMHNFQKPVKQNKDDEWW